ncbi:MAG: endonuclease/exonuclease/phosphatase family protein [Paramuribaculum sp.]|nr:endonuclease/exonuclease/phosphatase family protein [Paramuribaculum sp.]
MKSRLILIIDLSLSFILGLLLILSSYGGNIDPREWVLPSFVVMMFPLFLILMIILFIVNIYVSRLCAGINLLCLLICGNAILFFCPINFGHNDNDKNCFKLLTYNVFQLHDFSNPETTDPENPTLKFLLNSGSDIIALQECYSLNYIKDGQKPSKELIDSICKIYPYTDFSPEAIGLLSIYPFKKIEQKYHPDYSFQTNSYQIFIGSDTLTLINVHLQSIGLSKSDKELYMQLTEGQTEEKGLKGELKDIKNDLFSKLSVAFKKRANQIDKICEMTDEIEGKVIVCGDFNDVTLSYACTALLKHGFKDAYRQAGRGPAITYHDNRFYFRIDHVFYRGSLTADYATVKKNPSSDHYPVLVDFQI